MASRGIRAYFIHGQLALSERRRILEEFETGTGANVLLMTLGTGGEG